MDDNERRLSRIFQATDDGLWECVDLSQKTSWWSSRFYEMLGYEDQEFVPTRERVLEMIHPDDRERITCSLEEWFDEPGPFQAEYRMRSKSGEYVWLHARGNFFRDDAGQPHCMAGTIRDISRQREADEKLRENEELFRCVFERSATSMATTDLHGRFLRVNDAACRMLGYTRDELLSKSFADVTLPDDLEKSVARFKAMVRGETDHYSLDKRYRHRNGRLLWGTVTVSLVRDTNGDPQFVIAQLDDISDRKHAEQALEQSESWFRSLIELSSSTYVVLEGDGRIRYVSPSVERVLGWKPEELHGLDTFDLLHPDDVNITRELFAQILKTPGAERTVELRHIHKDGTWRWLRAIGVNRLENKHVQGIVVASQDITESRRSREALAESQERYQSLFNNSPVPLWEEDFSCVKAYVEKLRNDGVEDFRRYFADHPESIAVGAQLVRILDVNLAAIRLHEADSKDQLLAELSSVLTEKSYTAVMEQLLAIAEGRTHYECEAPARTIHGRELQMALRWSVVPGHEDTLERVHVSSIDITEQKQAELRLRESENRFRQFFEQHYLFITILSPEGMVLKVNEQALLPRGFRRDDFVGKFFWDTPGVCFEPAWQARIKQHLAQIRETGRHLEVEDSYRSSDGELRHVDAVYTVVLNADGQTQYIVIQAQDVTDRKQAEAALEKSDETFRSVFDQSQIAIQLYDASGVLVNANQSTLELFGVEHKDDLLGYVMWDSPDFTPEAMKQVRNGESVYLASQLSFDAVREEQLFPTAKKGVLQLDLFIFPLVVGGDVTGYTVQLVDVTERRKIEAQLRQAQKLDSIGRLAGGIAHDFNNILMPILGSVELAMLSLSEDDPSHADLLRVQEAANRAASLTRQILAFSRKQVLQPQVLNLKDVVAGFEDMLRRLITEDIQLTVISRNDLRPVDVDPRQIEQVLLNLAINARDAMPEGGRLTIETANVYLDEQDFTQYGKERAPGQYVMMAVSDTGHGIGGDIVDQIFEPFFTTKKLGQGTGLGLSTSLGIIEQHGGTIRVYSEPHQTTAFKVYLPAVEAVSATIESTNVDSPSMRGTETILLVEDEDMVRQMVKKTLAALGYEVVEAHHPNEAMRLAAIHKDTIDLLLTDVVMPGQSGTDLFQQMTKINPHLKVVYMSGYTDETIVHHGILRDGTQFLQKPFSIRQLGETVRQALVNNRRDTPK